VLVEQSVVGVGVDELQGDASGVFGIVSDEHDGITDHLDNPSSTFCDRVVRDFLEPNDELFQFLRQRLVR